jgi:hypothetical protein
MTSEPRLMVPATRGTCSREESSSWSVIEVFGCTSPPYTIGESSFTMRLLYKVIKNELICNKITCQPKYRFLYVSSHNSTKEVNVCKDSNKSGLSKVNSDPSVRICNSMLEIEKIKLNNLEISKTFTKDWMLILDAREKEDENRTLIFIFENMMMCDFLDQDPFKKKSRARVRI